MKKSKAQSLICLECSKPLRERFYQPTRPHSIAQTSDCPFHAVSAAFAIGDEELTSSLLAQGINRLKQKEYTPTQLSSFLLQLYDILALYKTSEFDLIADNESEKFSLRDREAFKRWVNISYNKKSSIVDERFPVVMDIYQINSANKPKLKSMRELCESLKTETEPIQTQIDAIAKKIEGAEKGIKQMSAILERSGNASNKVESLTEKLNQKQEYLIILKQEKIQIEANEAYQEYIRSKSSLEEFETQIQYTKKKQEFDDLMRDVSNRFDSKTGASFEIACRVFANQIAFNIAADLEYYYCPDYFTNSSYHNIEEDPFDGKKKIVTVLENVCFEGASPPTGATAEFDYLLIAIDNTWHSSGRTNSSQQDLVSPNSNTNVVEILKIIECKNNPQSIFLDVKKKYDALSFFNGEVPGILNTFFKSAKVIFTQPNRDDLNPTETNITLSSPLGLIPEIQIDQSSFIRFCTQNRSGNTDLKCSTPVNERQLFTQNLIYITREGKIDLYWSGDDLFSRLLLLSYESPLLSDDHINEMMALATAIMEKNPKEEQESELTRQLFLETFEHRNIIELVPFQEFTKFDVPNHPSLSRTKHVSSYLSSSS